MVEIQALFFCTSKQNIRVVGCAKINRGNSRKKFQIVSDDAMYKNSLARMAEFETVRNEMTTRASLMVCCSPFCAAIILGIFEKSGESLSEALLWSVDVKHHSLFSLSRTGKSAH